MSATAAAGRTRARAPLVCLLALTLFRLGVAARAPLSPDETYYWIWSRALAPGYPDHPPMVALWIRAGTALAGQTPLGVRLLGPVAALLASVVLARAVRRATGTPGAGIAAAALLNATLALGVGAVVMTPDTPLLFFWTLALAALLPLAAGAAPPWLWLAAGAALGAAGLAKLTALLPALGVAGWLLATRQGRQALRGAWPWAGGAVALALVTPFLWWSAHHGWAGLLRQGGRLGEWHPGRALRFLAELAGGQIGMATPLVAVLMVLGLARLARRARAGGAPALEALLLWTALLPAAVFLQHALGDRVQANWPAILYPQAAVAAAIAAAWRWRAASGLGIACGLAVGMQAAVAPLPLPRRLDPTLMRLGGWADLSGLVWATARASGAGAVAADEYGLASELAWHLASPPVVSAEPRWRSFALPVAAAAPATVLVVRSTREAGPPDAARWAGARRVGTATRGRGGIVAETYGLWVASPAAAQGGLRVLPARAGAG
jgi:4-amino-4-deoxy-L-arabinose transferase-like glycosyltransferase